MRKLRVALFTPLPPAQTGTADYGAALAAELDKLVELSVYEKPPTRLSPAKFDHLLYQIGNNPFHAAFYELALQHPGVVVVHEASVHYLVRSMTLSRGDRDGYLREVMYEFFGKDFGPHKGKHLPIEVPQQHEFMMLRRLLDHSRACIVHNRYAEQLIRRRGFRRPIGVVPHGACIRTVDRAEYCRKLGIDIETPLIGIFGYHRPDKQIWEALLLFKRLLDALPGARLLVVGKQHPQVPIEDGIRQLGLADRVMIKEHQSLDDFDGYLGACSVVLNLRAATFGETSGTMMRAFSLGRPVVVSDIGGARELPDDVCVKIPRDRHEAPVMIECLKWLLSSPKDAAAIGEQALRWVAEECTWSKVAQQYLAFLEERVKSSSSTPGMEAGLTALSSGASPRPMSDASIQCYLSRWIDPTSPASSYFAVHSSRLIRTLQLTPPGASSSRVMELGCYMQITPALKGLLGYSDIRGAYMGRAGGWHRSSVTSNDGEPFSCLVDLFNCEVDRFPYADGFFDTVLCCELLEHLEKDPMHMMAEINRVLKQHGTLLVTTPNAASFRALGSIVRGVHPNLFSKYVIPTLLPETRHAREYTPKELLRLFSDSGFAIQHLETAPYGERPDRSKRLEKAIRTVKRFLPLRGDCVYIVGQKISAPATRYPAWLYEQI